MDEKVKARIMDASKIRRILFRIATEIIERNRDLRHLVIVGVRTRGIYIGKRISKLIKEMEKVDVPVGVMDITPYRDDFTEGTPPTVHKTEIQFPITKKVVLLADDVLFTGRTIRADYVGKNLPTSRQELVQVRLKEVDGVDEVLITEPTALSKSKKK